LHAFETIGLTGFYTFAAHAFAMTRAIALADRLSDNALAVIGVANVAFAAAFFINLLLAMR
jgi:hypothetical protein